MVCNVLSTELEPEDLLKQLKAINKTPSLNEGAGYKVKAKKIKKGMFEVRFKEKETKKPNTYTVFVSEGDIYGNKFIHVVAAELALREAPFRFDPRGKLPEKIEKILTKKK